MSFGRLANLRRRPAGQAWRDSRYTATGRFVGCNDRVIRDGRRRRRRPAGGTSPLSRFDCLLRVAGNFCSRRRPARGRVRIVT